MSRCLWSARPGEGRLKTVVVPAVDRRGRSASDQTIEVLPEFEAPARRYYERVQQLGLWHLRVILIAIVLLLLAAYGASYPAMGLVILGLAGWMVWFPCATPETVAMVGIRRSILLVRIAAFFLGLTGLVFLLARWF